MVLIKIAVCFRLASSCSSVTDQAHGHGCSCLPVLVHCVCQITGKSGPFCKCPFGIVLCLSAGLAQRLAEDAAAAAAREAARVVPLVQASAPASVLLNMVLRAGFQRQVGSVCACHVLLADRAGCLHNAHSLCNAFYVRQHAQSSHIHSYSLRRWASSCKVAIETSPEVAEQGYLQCVCLAQLWLR